MPTARSLLQEGSLGGRKDRGGCVPSVVAGFVPFRDPVVFPDAGEAAVSLDHHCLLGLVIDHPVCWVDPQRVI